MAGSRETLYQTQAGYTAPAQVQPASGAPAKRAACPVALVTMPFIDYQRPSLQLGLLKAIAHSYGFPITTFHLNLDFARQIGRPLYEILSQHRGYMLGDWLFARAAFGEKCPDQTGDFLSRPPASLDRLLAEIDLHRDHLQFVRDVEVPAYIKRMADEIRWDAYRVVGFTSTFQQNAASFALARAIKARYPGVCLLFGGANFEGEMGQELVRSIECIDYAVIGEGDRAFPEFLIALSEGSDPAKVPGVVGRSAGALTAWQPRPPFTGLNELPTPDYSEYFERNAALNLLPEAELAAIDIPFESSRGCWWGQKHQCTFCGLNGAGITYRSKQPGRVMAELDELAGLYPSRQFEAVDNILDMSYLAGLFELLAAKDSDYSIFYEVKANLTRAQIRLLAGGGMRRMQPGIESLNTHVLKLMKKGISASQNVNTLRWGLYYGIYIGWNLIWGFPGETEEDYREQHDLLSHLRHLQPPAGGGRIWMERYSPVYMERERYPVKYIRPEASYAYIYPDTVNLDRIAYFFDYEFQESHPDSLYEPTLKLVEDWQAAWKQPRLPALWYWTFPDYLEIEDYRRSGPATLYRFEGPAAALYPACSDQPRTALSLQAELQLKLTEKEVRAALDDFCGRGLMMRDGNFYLSLALPGLRPRYAYRDNKLHLNRGLRS